MPTHAVRLRTIAVAACIALFGVVARSEQLFRAVTELVAVDVQIVAKDGTPVGGLKREDFEVFFDGGRRQVQSIEYVKGGQVLIPGTEGGAATTAGGSSPPAPFSGGRVFVVALDQASFPMAAQSSAREAVRRVIESVSTEDYLGLVAFPSGAVIAPTRDRKAILDAAGKIQGLRFDIRPRLNISATEAGLIKTGDSSTIRAVQQRECGLNSSMDCPTLVKMDADLIVNELHRQASLSISGLHAAIDGVATLPGRKTLLVISAGLPMSTRTGVEPNVGVETERLASLAAAANANLYVFFLNVHFLRAFSAEFGKINNTLFQDMDLFGFGLEKFAGAAGGRFYEIRVDSDPFVARVMRETSGAYVLMVEPLPRDRDGKDHFVRVTTKARGATVQHRLIVKIPPASK